MMTNGPLRGYIDQIHITKKVSDVKLGQSLEPKTEAKIFASRAGLTVKVFASSSEGQDRDRRQLRSSPSFYPQVQLPSLETCDAALDQH